MRRIYTEKQRRSKHCDPSGIEPASNYHIPSSHALTLARLGRLDEALALGRRVAERWPDQVGVRNNLAWYLLIRGGDEWVKEAEKILPAEEQAPLPKRILGVIIPGPRPRNRMGDAIRGTRILLRYRKGEYAEGLEEIEALMDEQLREWGPRFPDKIDAGLRRNHGAHRAMEAMFQASIAHWDEARVAFEKAAAHEASFEILELARSVAFRASA
jgi:hypothetical protein